MMPKQNGCAGGKPWVKHVMKQFSEEEERRNSGHLLQRPGRSMPDAPSSSSSTNKSSHQNAAEGNL